MKYVRSSYKLVTAFLVCAMLTLPGILHAQIAPNIQWQKCLGGNDVDEAKCIIQIPDGNYIVVGYVKSHDGDVNGNQGLKDAWIAKLDANGRILDQECFGGSRDEEFHCIIRTSDGGYAIAGTTASIDGDGELSGIHGTQHADAWVVKLNSAWVLEWQKCYGGSNEDSANSIVQTSDGGYLVAGSAFSRDGDVVGIHDILYYNSDAWLFKIDASGNLLWQKALGGSGNEVANSVLQTSDGGCIIAGSTSTPDDGDVKGNHIDTSFTNDPDPDHDGDRESDEMGLKDAWVVKLDLLHNIEWQHCYGGSKPDVANSIVSVPGGYVFAGSTESNDDDVSGYHGGATTTSIPDDGWVVRIDTSGKIIWQTCVGGTGSDVFSSIITTADNIITAAGWSASAEEGLSNHGLKDAWVAELNSSGRLKWQKYYGGKYDEEAASIIRTSDKGYAFAGFTVSSDGDVTGLHIDSLSNLDPDNDGDREVDEGAIPVVGDMWVVKLGQPLGVQNKSASVGKLNLTSFPNPTSTNVRLQYDLPKMSSVRINVISNTGQVLTSIEKSSQAAGHHEISLDLSEFAAGSYLINVEAVGSSETIETVITK
ncbi:MAG: T9SS type A sorting domain-containing protein [Bacteroidota bacterium]|nr:T9SS type A sorting domain-containing protein [Bacteroidota bacterium]